MQKQRFPFFLLAGRVVERDANGIDGELQKEHLKKRKENLTQNKNQWEKRKVFFSFAFNLLVFFFV